MTDRKRNFADSGYDLDPQKDQKDLIVPKQIISKDQKPNNFKLKMNKRISQSVFLLKGCPNCGAKVEVYQNGSSGLWYISCSSYIKHVKKFMDDIISLKNTDPLYNKEDEEIIRELYNMLLLRYPDTLDSVCLLHIEMGIEDK